MAVAIVSETGMAIHIPFKAYIRGKISSNGIRNMTCRVKLRKMDLEAIPKDWNRLVVTIWNPTIGNTPITMRIPCMATSMRFVSVVKARILYYVKKVEPIHPAVQQMVATMPVKTNAFFILA